MLTSFFSTSKPIHTIIVLVYMSISYFTANNQLFFGDFTWKGFLQVLGIWLLFIMTLFILNFVSQKNELTKRTSYRILLFASFASTLPVALQTPNIIIAGVFVMLAMRRILSFRSGLHMERKLFDAGLWLCLATITYFWTSTFSILLLAGLLFYGSTILRYWFIPLLAIICVGVLCTCYVIFIGEDQSFILTIIDDFSFDFSSYTSLTLLVPIAVFSTLFLWTIPRYIQDSKRAVIAQRPLYLLVIFMAIIAVTVVIITNNKTGAEWYFFLIPLAIIMTNYLENASGKFFKEFLLWIVVLLPFTHYFLS
ncbi:DUF6427 family protein [uncultured Dokdonia sp.]|uniref:DUF6427 family protein n=1 Tax=uncultured Dokdonia sp. TaxID=575653 RepID=UPI0026112782|nr:DUF6427 family protein [uncultured Dokdonia sp.]